MIPRDMVPRDTDRKKVRAMRQAIEHLDGRLQAGQLKEGEAKFLQATEHDIVLGTISISWVELATMLRTLHALVLYLNVQRAEPGELPTVPVPVRLRTTT